MSEGGRNDTYGIALSVEDEVAGHVDVLTRVEAIDEAALSGNKSDGEYQPVHRDLSDLICQMRNVCRENWRRHAEPLCILQIPHVSGCHTLVTVSHSVCMSPNPKNQHNPR